MKLKDLKKLIDDLVEESPENLELPVKIDSLAFSSVLDIDTVEVGDTYTGPHSPIVYIYPDYRQSQEMVMYEKANS